MVAYQTVFDSFLSKILEDEWGDPGERANSALEKIMILDGF